MDNSFEQGETEGSERRWEVVIKMHGDGEGQMIQNHSYHVCAMGWMQWGLWIKKHLAYVEA